MAKQQTFSHALLTPLLHLLRLPSGMERQALALRSAVSGSRFSPRQQLQSGLEKTFLCLKVVLRVSIHRLLSWMSQDSLAVCSSFIHSGVSLTPTVGDLCFFLLPFRDFAVSYDKEWQHQGSGNSSAETSIMGSKSEAQFTCSATFRSSANTERCSRILCNL